MNKIKIQACHPSENSGVSVKAIDLAYGDDLVLEDITISMKKGMVITLVGPNGCGKTSLLKIINGLLKPNKGIVHIDGKNVRKTIPRELARMVGLVPQIHKSSFPFSAMEVVLTGRMPYISAFSMPGHKDTEKAYQSLLVLGIEHLAHRPYTQISGGERQLVMIARALAQEPSVLLLDEPTSYLDFKNQVRMLKIVTDLAKTGDFTVIMTLHDPNHALMFSDEIVLLRKLESEIPSEKTRTSRNVVASGDPSQVMTPENIKIAYDVDVEILVHEKCRLLIPIME